VADRRRALIAKKRLKFRPAYMAFVPEGNSLGIFIPCVVSFSPPLWSSGQLLATDPEVPGSIPGAARFFEK
jgi:hypothetical protein